METNNITENDQSAATTAPSSVNTDPAPAGQPDAPTLPFDEIKAEQADFISVNLPYFLCWQLIDQTRTTNLLAAIQKVFEVFDESEEGKKLSEKDINQTLAYTALRLSLLQMIEKAAVKQLGSVEKAKPSSYLFSVPELATGDPTLDNAPVLVDDPATCADVDKLQEWVSTLQQMTRLQVKVAANNGKIDQIQQQTIEEQRALINDLQRIDKLNEQATKLTATKAYEKTVPKALNYVDLMLYLSEGYESETESVREALTNLGKKRLEKVLQKIVNDETDEAFYIKEEYDKIQNILGRLAMAVTNQAADSFARNSYQASPIGYQREEAANRAKQDTRKAKFIDAYSVYSQEEKNEEEQPDPVADESSSAA